MAESKLGSWLLNVATTAVTIAAVAIAWVRVSEYRTRNDPVELRPTKIKEWRDYAREGISLGASNARVTIVEFSDFFCPFCRKAAPDIRQVRDRFPQDVRFVYRHLPLGDASYPTAIAAECASRAGRFDAFHDLLFELIDSVATVKFSTIAHRAGIRDTSTFKSASNAHQTRMSCSLTNESTHHKRLKQADQDQHDHRREIEHPDGRDQFLKRKHDRVGHAHYKV